MSRRKKSTDAATLQAALLAWYDRHQRVLPWRAVAGRRPDPYHVWLSEIMLQQTTVVTVGPYFEKFLRLFPTVRDLAAADVDDVLAAWAGLGYYARARNLHKCAQAVVENHRGKFPADIEQLLDLPGIGPYTAAAIASIAFDIPAVAVDGNVERVVSRFAAITEPLPASKSKMRDAAAVIAANVTRPGDFTQAFMELGATVCTPRQPKCGLCPWASGCEGKKQGIASLLPAKSPKKKRPQRYGRVFWIEDAEGRFLIHKRTEKGLYQNMYQLPTTAWTDTLPEIKAKPTAGWNKVPEMVDTGLKVYHTFTHFDLTLDIVHIMVSSVVMRRKILDQIGEKWISYTEIKKFALPSLMVKVIKSCRTGDKDLKSV